MGEKLTRFVVKYASKERSATFKALSLLFGVIMFLAVIPLLLGILSHALAGYVGMIVPRAAELIVGIAGIVIGLFFLLWSVSTFWYVGKGTPVPFAAPTRLVITGPYQYTRNPILLGALSYFLGIGTLLDSLVAGLFMLIIAAPLGTLYHKAVEEKELLQRFGPEYEAYRKCTPFLIPRLPKK